MIPTHVKVAGLEYNVTYVDEIADEPNCMGDVNYHKTRIRIKNNLSEMKKEQTFVHELVHACFNEAGYNEQNEEMVTRLSNVLYQVLKDNEISFK